MVLCYKLRMKYVIYLALFFATAAAFAQTGTEIGVQGMASGGSYYDIARGNSLSKYGAERISPTGFGFQIGMVSDQAGNLFIRHISMKRQDILAPLEKQNTISYQSPSLEIGKTGGKAPLTYFVNGSVLYYSQIDKHLYAVSDAIENIGTGNNKWTVISPNVGAKYDTELQKGDFNFDAEVSALAAPVGYLNTNTTIGNTGAINAAMFGGALKLKSVIRYKNRYYFKIEISQDYYQSISKAAVSASQRLGHYELGYDVNSRLSANMFASNSELVLVNTDRHAIDVFNSFGLGVKYKIRKK